MRDRRGSLRRGGLSTPLAEAVKDEYHRQSSKKAHDGPHKKREKPPGSPQIRPATPAERRLAQKVCAAA
jgi:hypothetical protein